MTKFISDADTFNYAVNQGYEIASTVYMQQYNQDISLTGLIPINTSYNEWASGYTQLIGTQTGQAEWQTTYAKDPPFVDVGLEQVSAPFSQFSTAYQFNIGEVRQAALFGQALTTRRAETARRAAEQFRFDVAMTGQSGTTIKAGWTGLINSAFVTPVAAASAWVSNAGAGLATPEQIVTDLNNMLLGPASVAGTPGDLLSNRIGLPSLAYRHIASTPYGVTSPNETILSYFLKTNLYTLRTGQAIEIREMPQLATAATVGIVGGGRAIAWRNESQVLELPVPKPFSFEPIYQDGVFNFVHAGLERIGQLDLRLPGAVRYLDGVTQVPA